MRCNPQTSDQNIPYKIDGSDSVKNADNFSAINLEQMAKEKLEYIDVGKVDYSKKVGIVYNPHSGKKRDVR